MAKKLLWGGSDEVVTKYAIKDSHGNDINVASLQTQIGNLQNIGRFLSLWNASTGVATSDPPTSPYAYKTGDYFRIATSGNRIPTGSSYTTGETNYTTSVATLGIGDVVYYDGTVWQLQSGTGEGTIVDVQVNGTSVVQSGIANITKTGLGLGSVVNTGDSDTPVNGGTTKFTTGGAYTELAKKVNNPSSYYENNVVVFNSTGGIKDSSLGIEMLSVNNVAIIQDAITNLNGYQVPINNLHSVDFTSGNHTGLKLLKNTSDILTKNDAKTYMYCMCGTKYVPEYDQNVCKNSLFLLPNGTVYKPQYDTTNGLVLWYTNRLAFINDIPHLYKHTIHLGGNGNSSIILYNNVATSLIDTTKTASQIIDDVIHALNNSISRYYSVDPASDSFNYFVITSYSHNSSDNSKLSFYYIAASGNSGNWISESGSSFVDTITTIL